MHTKFSEPRSYAAFLNVGHKDGFQQYMELWADESAGISMEDPFGTPAKTTKVEIRAFLEGMVGPGAAFSSVRLDIQTIKVRRPPRNVAEIPPVNAQCLETVLSDSCSRPTVTGRDGRAAVRALRHFDGTTARWKRALAPAGPRADSELYTRIRR